MILLGCLLAFGASVAPRLFLILAWIFSDRWPRVWGSDFILPLLGIIFLPYTTIMYMLVWSPSGVQGWDWLWIILGLFLDLWKWTQVWANRQKGLEVAQGYYATSSGRGTTGGSSASSSSSSAAAASVPAATSAAAASAPAPATPDATPPPVSPPAASPPPDASSGGAPSGGDASV